MAHASRSWACQHRICSPANTISTRGWEGVRAGHGPAVAVIVESCVDVGEIQTTDG